MDPCNPLNLPTELPVARYRFEIALESELLLPAYAGSTLRGVFGHQLRRAACMTRQRDCDGCPLLDTCPYCRIFATPASDRLNRSQNRTPPQTYIIEAPEDRRRHYRRGEHYTFNLVLLGAARQQLPLIAYAFHQAFARGVGVLRGRGELINIAHQSAHGWQNIYQQQHITPHDAVITLPTHYPDALHLEIFTPMRIQSNSSALGIHRITAAALLRQLLRRVAAIADIHWQHPLQADLPALAHRADTVTARHELQWIDWKRYSNRQQREIIIGGIIGHWQFQQLPLEYSQLLHLGEWLHLGKGTVFGLGRYELRNVK